MVVKKKTIEDKKKIATKLKQIDWDGYPKIGWWQDAPMINLFYGFHKNHFDKITDDGIALDKTGHVILHLEPNSALGKAAIEPGIVNEYGMKVTVPFTDRVVLVVQMPKAYLKEALDLSDKLTNKALYDKWVQDHTNKKGIYQPAHDQAYYAQNEVKFAKKISPKFIIGFTLKVYEPEIPKVKWRRF